MSSDCLVLAQIGCGYWGPNLLRTSGIPLFLTSLTVLAGVAWLLRRYESARP